MDASLVLGNCCSQCKIRSRLCLEYPISDLFDVFVPPAFDFPTPYSNSGLPLLSAFHLDALFHGWMTTTPSAIKHAAVPLLQPLMGASLGKCSSQFIMFSVLSSSGHRWFLVSPGPFYSPWSLQLNLYYSAPQLFFNQLRSPAPCYCASGPQIPSFFMGPSQVCFPAPDPRSFTPVGLALCQSCSLGHCFLAFRQYFLQSVL